MRVHLQPIVLGMVAGLLLTGCTVPSTPAPTGRVVPTDIPTAAPFSASSAAPTNSDEPDLLTVDPVEEAAGERYLAAVCPSRLADDAVVIAIDEGDLGAVQETASAASAAAQVAAGALDIQRWPGVVQSDVARVRAGLDANLRYFEQLAAAPDAPAAERLSADDTGASEADVTIRIELGLPGGYLGGC